jgi:type II secretory pathway pseudopilin PulG
MKKTNKILTAEGFSLIEATIALTTLGITLAYAMPLFLYSKLNNIKSEVRTGALMVSQQIFDDLRGLPFKNIPGIEKASDPEEPINPLSPPRYTIIGTDGVVASVGTANTIPKNSYTVANRSYTAKIFYCETAATVANECDGDKNTANYKKFRVEIKDIRDQTVYEMEAGFTNFR